MTRDRIKLRTALLSLALCYVAPALATEAGLDAFQWGERHAFAQGDAVTEVARQRYQEGVKAFQAGRFEEARGAFLQAYALKRVPAVLLNIGQSELRTAPPHYEEAGNHLQQFLREHTAATPEERDAAEKGLADAKKHAGVVAIAVDAAGADVAVDGTLIGKSPLADPVFMRPGKHVISATANGKTVNEAVDAKVATPTAVSLTTGAGSAPPAVVPVPLPTPPLPLPPTPPPGPEVAPPPPLAMPPSPPPGMGPEQPAGRQPFFDWYRKKPLAWVGTGVAGVGLLGGVIFTIVANSTATTTNVEADTIRIYQNAHPGSPSQPCAQSSTVGVDSPAFRGPCSTLRDDVNAYNTDVALAATGWVMFGVGALGTLTYAMVDWKPKRETSGSLQVVPVISQKQQGLVLSGSF